MLKMLMSHSCSSIPNTKGHIILSLTDVMNARKLTSCVPVTYVPDREVAHLALEKEAAPLEKK
jgi:hypothetical protein